MNYKGIMMNYGGTILSESNDNCRWQSSRKDKNLKKPTGHEYITWSNNFPETNTFIKNSTCTSYIKIIQLTSCHIKLIS